jgi:hypothetical protein
MVADRGRASGPGFDLRHSFSEDETPQLIPQFLYLFRIGRRPEAFRKSERCLLFISLFYSFRFVRRFQALLDQFDQHTMVAEPPFLRDAFDRFGPTRGQGHGFGGLVSCWSLHPMHRHGENWGSAVRIGHEHMALNGWSANFVPMGTLCPYYS